MLPGETASPNTLVFPTNDGMDRHSFAFPSLAELLKSS